MERTPYVRLPIPVSAAQEICVAYGYDQIIILARRVGDEDDAGGEHLTTYGLTDEHSNAAAQIGFHLRSKVMGWHGDVVMSRAMVDVLDERIRQRVAEGYTAEHDDQHVLGEIARAGAAYAIHGGESDEVRDRMRAPPFWWPWSPSFWKPKDRYRDLVRACALLIAELERLNRRAKKGGAS
ncbi:hypothetical protein [Aureimonas sp. SK2]|uniref:hypothetical protein n=1 Tax=Aureimonas sp. SK2 TaxID=3015992 RepID=UPI0024439C40|nr:hypothetical protein [Aureimonas sp. SK2]